MPAEPPNGLTPAQQRAWERRRQLAERVLLQDAEAPLSDDDLLLVQRYVAGDLTLAQTIARLLDTRGRR